jgi:hypothetical protein
MRGKSRKEMFRHLQIYAERHEWRDCLPSANDLSMADLIDTDLDRSSHFNKSDDLNLSAAT